MGCPGFGGSGCWTLGHGDLLLGRQQRWVASRHHGTEFERCSTRAARSVAFECRVRSLGPRKCRSPDARPQPHSKLICMRGVAEPPLRPVMLGALTDARWTESNFRTSACSCILNGRRLSTRARNLRFGRARAVGRGAPLIAHLTYGQFMTKLALGSAVEGDRSAVVQ